MTINLAKLKALAEAAKRDPYDHVAANDYGMSMPPAMALELIAEIERHRLVDAEGCKPDLITSPPQIVSCMEVALADFLRGKMQRLRNSYTLAFEAGWKAREAANPVEQHQGKPVAWQVMADACAKQAIQQGIKNYAGATYTVTRPSGEQFEVVVTVQRAAAKSVQEINEDLRALLAERDALLESAAEGASILRSLIENIKVKDNYSPESTVSFLEQALHCVSPALSPSASTEPVDYLCTESAHKFVPFQREDRYIVIKRSDLTKLSPIDRDLVLSSLEHVDSIMATWDCPARQFLVIESDWPEYEPAWEAIQARVTGKPAEQHHEPIMLTAVAELVDDGDGGLEALWLLEGGTAELFAGMTLLVADNAPDLCSENGSAEVYTHADPGEVERLKSTTEHFTGVSIKAAEEVSRLRRKLAELIDAALSASADLTARDERMDRAQKRSAVTTDLEGTPCS
ncbi:hypothetical protein [Pseudomonas sp. HLMP]|uniref:hypothetical protein n=1 Tax=Pseudomonas sp. HLMP TaxID=3153767 RepID=UPI003967B02F